MRVAKAILETLFWMLAAGAVLFGVGVAVGLLTTPVLGYVAALGALAFVPVILRTAKLTRRRRAAATLSYLETAVTMNLPLNRMIYAARQSERGKLGFRLASLNQLLNEGYPIGSAVDAAVPEVDAREVALIEAAERLGRLPQTLRKLVREQRARAARLSNAGAFYRVYPFIMMVVITFVVGVIGIFVLPKYESIFADFGTKLPVVTVFVFDVARTYGIYVLILVSFVTLFWTGLTLWQTFHPTRLSFQGLWDVRDRIVWSIPILHGIERDRGLADGFELMADAMHASAPADRALAEAAQLRVNVALREKFDRWAAHIGHGMLMQEAARSAGMPDLVVGMLSSAQGTHATGDVFGFLGRYYNTRFSRAAALLEGAMVPVVVFFFAIIVSFVALSMFMPMITLIQNVSSPGHHR